MNLDVGGAYWDLLKNGVGVGEQNPESFHAPIILLDVVFIIFSFAKQLLKHPRNTLREAAPRRLPHRSPHCRCPPPRAQDPVNFFWQNQFRFSENFNTIIIECSTGWFGQMRQTFLIRPNYDPATCDTGSGSHTSSSQRCASMHWRITA
jgi:hypothetical protein